MSRLVKGQLFPGIKTTDLNIVATYNLAYNASLMVEDGLGIAVCFDSIVNVNNNQNDNLVFIPITDLDIPVYPLIIWKKHQTLSYICREYIKELQELTSPLH